MKIICDKCENYRVSPGGCVEKCDAVRRSPRWSEFDFGERLSGEKINCREFKKIFDHVTRTNKLKS